MTWGELGSVEGEAEIGEVTDGGTEVTVEVESAVPSGLYAVWVVKFAALDGLDQYDAIVTPDGDGLAAVCCVGRRRGRPQVVERAVPGAAVVRRRRTPDYLYNFPARLDA